MSATTPYRTNMATQHSLSKTPSRRALGDLTPKALNSPSQQPRNAEPSEAVRARSALKKVTSHIPSVFADKENILTPHAPQGKKRGIDEVDDAERVDHAKMLARGREEPIWHTETRLTTAAMKQHTENNPVGLADPGSPTERNTPTPEPEPMQDSQKSNQSFSDFLNFELCASQKSEQGVQTEPAPISAPTSAPAPVETKSRAERLRTRLRLATYKVKTNQVTKSGVDIISTFEAGASYSSGALNASSSTAITSSAESIGRQKVPNITISSPRREPLFVQANLDPGRPIAKLGQPPVQFAVPKDGAQISSRMVHAYGLSLSPPGAALPQSASPNRPMSPVKQNANYGTASKQRMRLGEHDDVDLEPRADAAHWRLQRLKQQSYRAGDLTSSAVRGGAAEGLLELMTSTR